MCMWCADPSQELDVLFSRVRELHDQLQTCRDHHLLQGLVHGCSGHMTVMCHYSGLLLEYTLKVDGKSLKKFIESQAKNTRVWHPQVAGQSHRVVLGKYMKVKWPSPRYHAMYTDIEKMEVYVDGEKMDACVSCLPHDTCKDPWNWCVLTRESLLRLGQRHTLL